MQLLAFLANGGSGCISVTANVVPGLSAKIYNSWKKREVDEAMRLNQLLYPLKQSSFF